jgi:apolipoprotein D and lipocalin family protein
MRGTPELHPVDRFRISRALAAWLAPAIMAAVASLASEPAQANDPAPLTTVGAVDLARYAGRWYELANYPNRFQRVCVRDTTAEYSLLADGRVRVVNRCRTADGVSEVDGVARRIGDGTDRLEVSFLPAALRWLPVGWGNYWVIGLAPDYRYAVIGEPSREYLWVLSRTPTLAADDWRAIEALLRERGYDPAKLVATPQDGR